MPQNTLEKVLDNLGGTYTRSFLYFFPRTSEDEQNYKFFSPINDPLDFFCRAGSVIAAPIFWAFMVPVINVSEIIIIGCLAFWGGNYLYNRLLSHDSECANAEYHLKDLFPMGTVGYLSVSIFAIVGAIASSLINFFEVVCSTVIALTKDLNNPDHQYSLEF